MKRLEDEINNFVSPEHKILLSKDNEIILGIQELRREIRNYSSLSEPKSRYVDENLQINDDYDRYIKLWKSSLFMEEGNDKN